MGTCVILKHLVNSTSKEISDAGMKEHNLISGVLKLLSVNDLEVRAAFAQLIVAMGKASLLTMGGGSELVLFLVKQCAIDRGEIDEWERNQKVGFRRKNASGLHQRSCALGVSVSWMRLVNAQKSRMALLFTVLIPSEYSGSITPVTKCLSSVAKNANADTLKALLINSDVPKNSEIFARLVVLSSSIIAKEIWCPSNRAVNLNRCHYRARGWTSLDLLIALGPILTTISVNHGQTMASQRL